MSMMTTDNVAYSNSLRKGKKKNRPPSVDGRGKSNDALGPGSIQNRSDLDTKRCDGKAPYDEEDEHKVCLALTQLPHINGPLLAQSRTDSPKQYTGPFDT